MATGQVTLRQSDRWMRVDTPLGRDKVVLEELYGYESLSEPYRVTLQLLSTDHSIAPEDILRKNVTVTIPLPGGGRRFLNGNVNRFQFHGVDREYDLAIYGLDFVPWLWFLSLTHDSRIFQQMTAVEIIEKVFGRHPEASFEVNCSGRHPMREYCVQYRESDLNFVSRLMEEEGIFYYFEHRDGNHTLILSDESANLDACPEESTFQVATTDAAVDEGWIRAFQWEHHVDSERITLRDYDYLKASTGLEVTAPQGAGSAGAAPRNEYYDYPGRYRQLSDGETYAKLRLQRRESALHVAQGDGAAASMTAGHTFELEGHPVNAANQAYLLTNVSHTGSVSGYRSGGSRSHYSNAFECIPTSIVYRPPRAARRPFVQGSQTAVVVGPSSSPDEEIYTDDQGRVKIQFHWDREGQKDEKSSCWVRVSTPWAGKGWGGVHLPRIGHEVVVDFIEGDPDRPIITGRVYNSDNRAPYSFPADRTQSGFKSRSSTEGGSANFNEIRMEDKKGSELLYLHAEKDKQVVVEHDRTESVGNDESIEIGHDRTESVGHDESITVKNDQSIEIGGKRSESVAKDEQTSIGGKRTEEVGKDENLSIGGAQDVSVAKDQTVSVGGDRSADVKKDDELQVGSRLKIKAGKEILIQTGNASLLMKSDGTITLKGKNLKLDGKGAIDVKAKKAVTVKGQQIKQN